MLQYPMKSLKSVSTLLNDERAYHRAHGGDCVGDFAANTVAKNLGQLGVNAAYVDHNRSYCTYWEGYLYNMSRRIGACWGGV
jgi:hypothetical protein